MSFKLARKDIQGQVVGTPPSFPKYTTQLLNLANQNSHGTRPRVVGQMSELIEEFPGREYADWRKWYRVRYPDAIAEATTRVLSMVDSLKHAITLINEDLVKAWLEDLVLAKTFSGFRFQQAIITELGRKAGLGTRRASAADEARGIDAYIGDQPISIKPVTYRNMPALREGIAVPIIYYEKTASGISVDDSAVH